MRKAFPAADFSLVRLFFAVDGAQFVNLTGANPRHRIWLYEGDVSLSRCAEPPIFFILSSENHTVPAVDTISLTLNVSVGNSNTASGASAAIICIVLLVYFSKRRAP